MRFTAIPVALALLIAGAVLAQAQSVRDIPAPRETPPVSFRGAQYVDSQGCVFVRAGVDGRVIWVPRVNASRKVLCGYPPTRLAGTAPVVVLDAPVPQVAPSPPQQPSARVAARQAAPKSDDTYIAAPVPGTTPGALRCPARAPVAARVPLQGGGTAVLCLSQAGLLNQRASVAALEGARPVAASANAGGSVLVCPRTAPVARRLSAAAGGTMMLCTAGDGSLSGLAVPKRRNTATVIEVVPAVVIPPRQDLLQPVVPAGYKLAWKDGRLNPNRARGTAAGQLAQDQIWTRETPARLVTAATPAT